MGASPIPEAGEDFNPSQRPTSRANLQYTFLLPVALVVHDVVVVEAVVEGVVGAAGQPQQGGLQEQREQQHGWGVRPNPELRRGKGLQ